MANAQDIKAGGAWVSITASSKELSSGLSKADTLLRNWSQRAKKMMDSFGGGRGGIFGGVVKGLGAYNAAIGAAKKAWQSYQESLSRLRTDGTDEQRESIARLDDAIRRLKESWYGVFDSAVSKTTDSTVTALKNIQNAFNTLLSIGEQLKEKFSGTFSALQSSAEKISGAWERLMKKLSETPMIAKANTDALRKMHEEAMGSWSSDNALLEELDRIDDKINKSSEDIAKANNIVDQLKSRWGDVGIEVNQVSGEIKGLDEAQRKMMAAQNKARLEQLKLEKQSIEAQQRALEIQNQKTMQNAGPGAMSILGGWLGNTAGVLAGGSYKSFTEIGEEKNQGRFESARAQVEGTRQQQAALKAQGESLDAQIKSMEEGQAWWEQAGKEPSAEQKKTPVGSNQKAGSMVDKTAGLSPAEAEIEKLNQQYAQMLQARIEEIRGHGYSQAEAEEIAVKEFAEDRKAVDQKIAKIREDAAKREAEILGGGADILNEASNANKSDLEKELAQIEQRYIDTRKNMIDSLVALGKSEDEAAKMADVHLREERVATDKLKSIAIRRDHQEKAMKQAEELQKQAEAAKRAEIEQARQYLDSIEKGLAQSERTYTSSGGTFSAFDELDTRNIAAESLNVEKEQLKQQKDMVERLRELIDAYEADDSTLAVFA